jgi:hypothetical protein
MKEKWKKNLRTEVIFPGGTICTGACRYGVGPASAVDPHPEISAESVGWYFQMN